MRCVYEQQFVIIYEVFALKSGATMERDWRLSIHDTEPLNLTFKLADDDDDGANRPYSEVQADLC